MNAHDVAQAALRLAGHVEPTPCLHSRTLSDITGAEVWLKFENLQFTASFKERGALNRLARLDDDERRRGVIAVSAGNHAQGVAFHAQRLGIPATIVMPLLTPAVKIERTRGFGAQVVLAGDGFDEALQTATRIQAERGLSFVHPYDDADVIAGQGTIGIEMLDACPHLDTLVVAIGGGGLISGIAVAARARRPELRIIGVQCAHYPSMYNALHGTDLPAVAGTMAEGIAVATAGTLTSQIVRSLVDDIVLVDEHDLEQAVLMLLEVEKTVSEGAGAAGLAALLAHRERFAGHRVGLVLTGGNIDPLLLAGIIERGMVRSGRLARLRLRMRDVPGALARMTATVAAAQANIDEVHHQRAFGELPIQSAEVELVIQARGHEHVAEVIAALRAAGFDPQV